MSTKATISTSNENRASSDKRLKMETIASAILPVFVTIALLALLAVMYAISWTIEFHL